MLLSQSTWQEVEEYLNRSTGIIVPVGSTEQHGPNGLLGTDAICPEVIAHEAGEKAGILIAPTFSVGVAQHHMAFAGTITLRPSTMVAAMADWTASLRRHGFTRIFWLNGHGGNCATIEAAFAEIYASASLRPDQNRDEAFRQTLKNWWDLNGVDALSRELYPTGLGSHATPSEVSVTYYAYPHAVKDAQMSPKIAPNGRIHDADQYRATFPDGRIGSDPSQASIEDGEKLVKLSVDGLIEAFNKFVAR